MTHTSLLSNIKIDEIMDEKPRLSPKNLSHKPIVSVNNYADIDSIFKGNTDAVALSIGRAQYDSEQISLKVWRHTGEKWSRQSEELPIHRNLDLTILFLKSMMMDPDSQSIISRQSENLSIDEPDEMDLIRSYYLQNKEYLLPRLKELRDTLSTFLGR